MVSSRNLNKWLCWWTFTYKQRVEAWLIGSGHLQENILPGTLLWSVLLSLRIQRQLLCSFFSLSWFCTVFLCKQTFLPLGRNSVGYSAATLHLGCMFRISPKQEVHVYKGCSETRPPILLTWILVVWQKRSKLTTNVLFHFVVRCMLNTFALSQPEGFFKSYSKFPYSTLR